MMFFIYQLILSKLPAGFFPSLSQSKNFLFANAYSTLKHRVSFFTTKTNLPNFHERLIPYIQSLFRRKYPLHFLHQSLIDDFLIIESYTNILRFFHCIAKLLDRNCEKSANAFVFEIQTLSKFNGCFFIKVSKFFFVGDRSINILRKMFYHWQLYRGKMAQKAICSGFSRHSNYCFSKTTGWISSIMVSLDHFEFPGFSRKYCLINP